MKKSTWILLYCMLSILAIKAQQITVDNTYTAQNLIEDVLIEGICSNTSNYNSSLALEAMGIAYFEKNGSVFPFENGIVLSTGNAMNAPGPAGPVADTGNSGIADADLESASGVTNTDDAAYLEFDFVPTTTEIRFNYLFVSEEYNQDFECTYSDAFAFILTHVDSGAITNLAVLPTSDSGNFAVTCTNIRPDVPGSCLPVNEAYFDHYNFDPTDATVADNSAIVYGGQTVPLTASATVIPGDTYHIKLVIADQEDSQMDSAVFLEGGSFSLGVSLSLNGTLVVDNVANLCEGETATLEGEVAVDGVVYQWSQDGVEMTIANGFPQDEINATLNPIVSGVYTLHASIPSGGETCEDEQSVTVTFSTVPVANTAPNIRLCDDGSDGIEVFTLTDNDAAIYGTQSTTDYTISYHASQADADTNTSALTSPHTNTSSPETIYARIENNVNATCYATTTFQLFADDISSIASLTPLEACDVNLTGLAEFDITLAIPEVIGTLDSSVYSISFHTSLVDAQTNTNPIDSTLPYVNTAPYTDTIYVRLENNNNTDCYATQTLDLLVNPLPSIVSISDYALCDDNTDGFVSLFDLSTKDTEITGGATDIVVSYHTTLLDAEAGENPIDNTVPYTNTVVNGNTLYVQLLDTITSCSTTTQFEIVVDLKPVLFTTTLVQCDEDGIPDGFMEYNLTQGNDELLGGDATGYSFTYHLTAADAVSNTNPQAPIPFTNTVNPQTLHVAVTNDVTGCVNYAELILDVTATDISGASLETCDDDYDGFTSFTLSDADAAIIAAITPGAGALTVAYYENNNDAILETNQLPDSYTNTSSPQTIYVRVDNDNDCFGISTISLTVLPLPVSNVIADIEACSDNATANFDLETTLPEVLAGNPAAANLTVTFYETQENADNGTAPITSPYNASTGTPVFVRVVNDDTSCVVTTMNFNLIVYPRPIISDPEPIALCDDETSDGSTNFDLTTRYEAIIGTTTNITVSYYTVEADAISGTGPSLITTPDNFTNTVNPQIIYIRVQDDMNGCPSFTTLTLNVVAAPDTFLPDALFYCDADNDGFGLFDLEDATSQITGGASSTAVLVTYHETLAEANAGVGVIDTTVLYPNVSSYTQTVYVRVALAVTGCFNITTVDLAVIDSPSLPSEALEYALCDDFNDLTDGLASFDLATYNAVVLANIAAGTTPSDYTVSYYTALDASGSPDPASLIANPSAFQNTSTPDQTIYVSVVRNDVYSCESIKEINLHVDLLPDALYQSIDVCDDAVADGFYEFNLTDYTDLISGGATDVTLSFYTIEADAIAGAGASLIANPLAFTNTSNPQSIFVRVYRASTGCFAVTPFTLHVDPNPTPLNTADIASNLGVLMACDGNVDGAGDIAEQVAEFDLTTWESQILTGTGPGVEVGVSASYYTDAAEAATATNPIATPTTFSNTSNPQTIYVRVTNDGTGITPATSGTGCYQVVSFQIYVPMPWVTVSGDTILCVDSSGVPLPSQPLPVITAVGGPDTSASYSYQWALNGSAIAGATSATLTAVLPGDYTVTVAGPTDLSCVNTATHTITVSGMPDDYTATISTNAFADFHQIVATATSSSAGIEFLFSLDGGAFQNTGVFNDVSPGLHAVTIKDTEGCWEDTLTVLVVDYPHFFTPNNDGYNDTWQVTGSSDVVILGIVIYDRQGKALHRLAPGESWDGRYNGTLMPSNDYWFVITYTEGVADPVQKEFRAHFSLKL